MSTTIHRVREQDVPAKDVPGRVLRWFFSPESAVAKNCSMNVVEIGPGQTVRPAHSHPNAEEVIYAISGAGRVMVDGEVTDMPTGSAVLFPVGSVHMVRNPYDEPLKLACFFAPAVDFDGYQFYEDVEFPE
ncbi:MAG: cupin domain-containing protein [Spirochaetota bacterium]